MPLCRGNPQGVISKLLSRLFSSPYFSFFLHPFFFLHSHHLPFLLSLSVEQPRLHPPPPVGAQQLPRRSGVTVTTPWPADGAWGDKDSVRLSAGPSQGFHTQTRVHTYILLVFSPLSSLYVYYLVAVPTHPARRPRGAPAAHACARTPARGGGEIKDKQTLARGTAN